MPFWDERFEIIKKSYPEIKTDQFHIDILTARFVLTPEWFDVVVASNLFGDILSDLGPACTGTIGIAPSGKYKSRVINFHLYLNQYMAQHLILLVRAPLIQLVKFGQEP